MEVSLIIAGSVATGASLTFALVSTFIPIENQEEIQNLEIKWEYPEEGESPPEPVFNIQDPDDCQSQVTLYYDQAVENYELNTTNKERLEGDFQQILDN